MRGPGIKPNETTKHVVVNIDLAPTFVEMGGGKLDSVDGISFLSTLLDNEAQINGKIYRNFRCLFFYCIILIYFYWVYLFISFCF